MTYWVNRRLKFIERIKMWMRVAKERDKILDKEKTINILGSLGVARRTAREYLIAAGFK